MAGGALKSRSMARRQPRRTEVAVRAKSAREDRGGFRAAFLRGMKCGAETGEDERERRDESEFDEGSHGFWKKNKSDISQKNPSEKRVQTSILIHSLVGL